MDERTKTEEVEQEGRRERDARKRRCALAKQSMQVSHSGTNGGAINITLP